MKNRTSIRGLWVAFILLSLLCLGPSYGQTLRIEKTQVTFQEVLDSALSKNLDLQRIKNEQGILIKERNLLWKKLGIFIYAPPSPKLLPEEKMALEEELADLLTVLDGNNRLYRKTYNDLFEKLNGLYSDLLTSELQANFYEERLSELELGEGQAYSQYLQGLMTREAYEERGKQKTEALAMKEKAYREMGLKWQSLGLLCQKKYSETLSKTVMPPFYTYEVVSVEALLSACENADYSLYENQRRFERASEDLALMKKGYRDFYGSTMDPIEGFLNVVPVDYTLLFPVYEGFLQDFKDVRKEGQVLTIPYAEEKYPLIALLTEKDRAEASVKLDKERIAGELTSACLNFELTKASFEASELLVETETPKLAKLEKDLLTGSATFSQVALSRSGLNALVYDRENKRIAYYRSGVKLGLLLDSL